MTVSFNCKLTQYRRAIVPGDGYAELIAEFPLQPLYRDDQVPAARAVAARVEAIPRGERTYGQAAYLGALDRLVAAYLEGRRRYLHDRCEPDARVLHFLLMTTTDPELATVPGLARRAGVPPANLEAVLAGRRDLTRPEIARVTLVLGVAGEPFPAARLPARPADVPFRVEESGIRLRVTHRPSRRTAYLPDDAVFAIPDDAGNPFPLDRRSPGYAAEVEAQLNRDPEATLRAYFPEETRT